MAKFNLNKALLYLFKIFFSHDPDRKMMYLTEKMWSNMINFLVSIIIMTIMSPSTHTYKQTDGDAILLLQLYRDHESVLLYLWPTWWPSTRHNDSVNSVRASECKHACCYSGLSAFIQNCYTWPKCKWRAVTLILSVRVIVVIGFASIVHENLSSKHSIQVHVAPDFSLK